MDIKQIKHFIRTTLHDVDEYHLDAYLRVCQRVDNKGVQHYIIPPNIYPDNEELATALWNRTTLHTKDAVLAMYYFSLATDHNWHHVNTLCNTNMGKLTKLNATKHINKVY